MKKIYEIMYGRLEEMAFKSNEIKFQTNAKTKLPSEDREFTKYVDVPFIDNANYYIFAGGTKPFHNGHYKLMEGIINSANNDKSGKKPIVIFYIGLGSRGGTADEVAINADDVYEIWKKIVEPHLQTLANDNVDVYVEYGGGPVQKVLYLKGKLNRGEIKNSKIIVYSDDNDVVENYLTPVHYANDEKQSFIDRKRLENPSYVGYKKGDESPHSPPLAHNLLRKIRTELDVFKAMNPDLSVDADFVLSPDQSSNVKDFIAKSNNLYDLPGDVIYPGSFDPNLQARVASGSDIRRAAAKGDIESIKQMLPDFVLNNPESLRMYLIKLGIPSDRIETSLLSEIKRANKGTKEYSGYLDDLIKELQHLKSSYGYRSKDGKQYRKEAAMLQNAISELNKQK